MIKHSLSKFDLINDAHSIIRQCTVQQIHEIRIVLKEEYIYTSPYLEIPYQKIKQFSQILPFSFSFTASRSGGS